MSVPRVIKRRQIVNAKADPRIADSSSTKRNQLFIRTHNETRFHCAHERLELLGTFMLDRSLRYDRGRDCLLDRTFAKFRSCSHDAVIRVYNATGNVIETHEHAGDFKEP